MHSARLPILATLFLIALAPKAANSQSFHQPSFNSWAALGSGNADGARDDAFQRYRVLPCEFLKVAPSSVAPEAPTAALGPRTACEETPSPPRYFLLQECLCPPPQQFQSLSQPSADFAPSALGFTLDSPSPGNSLFISQTTLAEPTPQHREGFHWWPALQQSFYFLIIEHGFRIADDPFLRYLLWHKPFWHDWAASNKHFYFNQWGDGDDFLVNYIGHPMQGSVTGNIEIVNDPRGRSLRFGRSRAYWMSRLRAMAWSAVYSAQFEAGPLLSESAIGNEGGYFYKPGCDPYLTCSNAGNKPITNNTGWVDFVVTPLVGTGWLVLEDSIETEIVDRLAGDDDRLRWKLLRAGLSPAHVMANFVGGKVPWYRYRLDGPDGGSIFGPHFHERPKFSWDGVQRWEFGAHYAFLSLPMDWEGCTKCRVGNSGFGMNSAFRITNHLWVDSDVNYFPGSGSYANKGNAVQGMFGPRYGYTGKNWALYFKLRPGFIYYDKTLTADSGSEFINATRFAFDVGSVFEWHTSQHSAIRIDAGTTVVRYLTGRSDPRQPVGNILSTDYIVSQSNFQIGTGYTYR
ncbi:MAG: hypothetical protein WA193_12130, partial [Candidatus Acidiferrales bacterium]